MDCKQESMLLEPVKFKDHLLIAKISMMVGQISTKIGSCIENRHIFMLANFKDF